MCVLQKLLKLQLWPGTLWAALSDSPSQYCVELPGGSSHPQARSLTTELCSRAAIDQSLVPSQLIADAVKRSSKAHLFHFYPVLCEIVAIPRRTPSAWVPTSALSLPKSALSSAGTKDPSGEASRDVDHGSPVELDARSLVKECLREVGKEMGVRQ